MKNLVYLAAASVLFLAATVHASSDNSSIAVLTKGICKCDNYTCGCCEYMKWTEAGLAGNLCTNFSYVPQNVSITVTATWNSYTVYNTTISATNIRLKCIGIPGLERVAFDICLKLYDFTFVLGNVHGCFKLSVSVRGKVEKWIDLGCYNISKESVGEAYVRGRRRVLEIMDDNVGSSKFWEKSKPSANDLKATMISLIDAISHSCSWARESYFSLESMLLNFFDRCHFPQLLLGKGIIFFTRIHASHVFVHDFLHLGRS